MKTSHKVLLTLGVLTVLALPAIGWGVGVAVSGPKGQGDAYAQKNSAQNWTAAQARFEELYADIVATDRKITVAAEQKAADPGDKTAADTYLGTVNYCISAVGEYNAEARKYLAADFRAADLPAQIDNYDPSTDCKE
ncbi:hypothetical protein SEA_GRETCHEN_28 [Microbacterium phage Gretchen]|uniref:Uncharacterized protein n=1 Tax=Microbacterium phage Percival TaxID=2201439 RepID=A0A2Z4Q6K1_9CAUD|nr:hypothetical protein PBI_PERCIVAL_28 [Microbacterium phage Percival]UDL14802.1 hypothetical protein SEA_GRETCHEN_28 [Microbacterium phage Gretchen]